MAPKTSNKTPVIVYLNDDDHAELVKRSDGESLSATARRLLHVALKSSS